MGPGFFGAMRTSWKHTSWKRTSGKACRSKRCRSWTPESALRLTCTSKLPLEVFANERVSASDDAPAVADVDCVAGDAALRLDCPQARPDARSGRNCWRHPDRTVRTW